MKKVLLAMSGGVDSGVSAHLLKDKGFLVEGVTLVFHSDIETARCNLKICCSSNDVEDARELCNSLGIKHRVIHMEKEFERKIVQPFLDLYYLGITPNPCGWCNRFLKIGFLVDYAIENGFDYLATGHYARQKDGFLYRGLDRDKDQTYFLSMVKKHHIEKLYFPLGELTKEKVREIARERGLNVAEKKESQELCFTGGKKPGEFAAGKIPLKAGMIKHINGAILGYHKGLAYYTIGQRKGLGISWKNPLYVVKLDFKTNTVFVGEKEYLKKTRVKVRNFNLIGEFKGKLSASIRYNQKPQILANVENIRENEYMFEFENPVRGVAPGQLLVCFSDNDMVVGGGIIEG
ncbi:tRNA-specific 2-thiouridylase [Thermotomaculum hydrothermale]|uniref:tRNA-specific 2-thiouridylase MnmA n=1 Tax=Thermotomaculum hydrothermale TaxID=981385 RepID=A0A7R6PNZ4_9BACT|nr:tRNA 2-thiouridine(34) synthase MnmA [Thermotomaculum hydrothermale]BBB31706.1 tRNA-specific 2-thiouridylase [Thermotomaculum hydrothermale]